MIPSLLLIRTNEKKLLAFTCKKTISLGSQKDSDIIINHPEFSEGNTIIRPYNLIKGSSIQTNELKSSFLFQICSLKADKFTVHLIHFHRSINIALIILASLSFYIFTNFINSQSSRLQDWTAIPLPAEGIYGYCRQDKSHKEGAGFTFQSTDSNKYILTLFAGGSGDGSSLKVLLNGHIVKDNIELPSGWGKELSIPLPSGQILPGQNKLDVHTDLASAKLSKWGISSLKILSFKNSADDLGQNGYPEPGKLLKILSNESLTGDQLAYYYNRYGLQDNPNFPSYSTSIRDLLLKNIEQKMIDLLRRTAFEAKSNEIEGDHESAKLMLKKTAEWIPESWEEGWRIFNAIRF